MVSSVAMHTIVHVDPSSRTRLGRDASLPRWRTAKATSCVAWKSYQLPLSCLVLLVMLAWTGLAFQENGPVVYDTETLISRIQSHGTPVASMYASAKTIVHYDDTGTPDIISFDINGKVQGLYGIDGAGRPANTGRVFFKPIGTAMPYLVTGPKGIYTYHLKYLEITTVRDSDKTYRAYATKAIPFDNKVDAASKQPASTFDLPPGGQLVIDHGKIKIGENYISPGYSLSGTVK
jgi:hypothetical protein